MKVLVIGSGGREHAIVKALNKSARIKKIYVSPGNGGISCDAQCVSFNAVNIASMTDFAVETGINYVVVTPDDPLAAGMVDALERKGIRCFGPDKKAARIESSKVFSKNLMKKYGIPTALYEVFNSAEKASEYVQLASLKYPLVIKADGLALGKGVIIAENRDEALNAIKLIMTEKKFGDSGLNVVIEEYLTGSEVTILAFTDGKTIKPMVSSMDHKRAFDGNKGPNTGGMGVVAPAFRYTKNVADICDRTIFIPTIQAMQKEGCPFKGCLYIQLMLTTDGPKVIEYNSRFGDPEAQAVLPLLETELLDIMEAVTDEKLDSVDIKWSNAYSACVVLASGGYPSEYKTGVAITGLGENGNCIDSFALKNGVIVYHAGTEKRGNSFYTTGGRVLNVTATGQTLNMALDTAYNAVRTINFDGMYYRKDIGKY